MKHLIQIGLVLLIGSYLASCSKTPPPPPFGPVPTENQLRWQQMEYYAFLHFSLNTYTDQSWGFGNEDLTLFKPDSLDTRQWARICKEAGMKGIIITAKHHCGFCLWPTETTAYSVKNTPWKNGEGDVLRELAEACQEYGLKLGMYVSPWDRNHPEYGKPEYIHVFRNQIKEVLTHYGEVFEIWFDGANGGTGYYGGANENRQIDRTTYYDWQPTYKMIRELQPNIVIWNDGGDRADLRWVGTEAGFVGETNWSLLDSTGEVNWGMLHFGHESGNAWVPAEVNTSIRPEWFYHPGEDGKVKTLPHLMDTYYHSIGRNGTFLLNFPIMPNGLIHPADEKAALDLAREVKEAFAVNLSLEAKAKASNVRGNDKKFNAAKAIDNNAQTYWSTDDSITTASIIIDFGKPTIFNRFMVQEYIRLGQRVKSFTVDAFVENEWKELAHATTIGYKRILRFPSVESTQLRFNITASKACPLISNIGVYNAPQLLTPPTIIRNKAGEVIITPADQESEVYYTLDGSIPTTNSSQYLAPIQSDGRLEVKAIAFEAASGNSSAMSYETFDLPRKAWRIVGVDDEKAEAVLDGNIHTAWHQNTKPLPVDFIIDLGKLTSISGFRYHPDMGLWGPGIIAEFQFFVSANNQQWKLVCEGEFSNIQNNPLWQTKKFETENARYIKFRALKNTAYDNNMGYAEFDLITN